MDKQEKYDVIDENENVIGQATFDEINEKKLLHKITRVLIFNSKGELLLQKRSMKVYYNPGRWTSSSSGKVNFGESYEEAAGRELKEELGIETKLTFLFKVRESEDVLAGIFKGFYDKEIKHETWEIEKVEFMPLEKVKSEMTDTPKKFSPGFVKTFEEFLRRQGKGGRLL